ncbi:cyclin-dependent protein kinase inhibitor SMR6-like [Hibiscus syriacus]|uniref:cyclin-dependent protein kinase inhibitor SMR6-like n=1 Tax=Hibiscus syriacus TaxID=106335 RepID=UPI001921DCC7|nr:cyclin-dependent protein kinase inhibitor SMR6-like [Hibiscus syriacus]
MGVPGKLQVDGGVLESDAKKWVIAGISLRAPLKSIYTIPVDHHKDTETAINDKEEDEEESCSSSTTPTGQEARIPTSLTCPPPPTKRKPTLKCNYGGAREFFTPPELDTVFIRRHV